MINKAQILWITAQTGGTTTNQSLSSVAISVGVLGPRSALALPLRHPRARVPGSSPVSACPSSDTSRPHYTVTVIDIFTRILGEQWLWSNFRANRGPLLCGGGQQRGEWKCM